MLSALLYILVFDSNLILFVDANHSLNKLLAMFNDLLAVLNEPIMIAVDN